jgi:dephospho-CoA kinase
VLKVGLTGGIGSGKSTISQMFRDNSIPVIDSDIISREIFVLYPEVSLNIRNKFGAQYFNADGSLKRRELGNLVFKDRIKKQILEDITLPFIIKEIFKRIDKYNSLGEKMCIIDAPTLIEVGLNKVMDCTVLVWVDVNTQFIRVKKRDLLKEEEVMNRIEAQMPLDEKKKYADFVIDNSKDLEHTKEQFKEVLQKLSIYEGET